MKIPKVDLQEIALRNRISLDDVKRIITHIRKGMRPLHKQFSVKENGSERQYTVIRQGIGSLNTPYGLFWQFDFFVNDRWKKYSVVVCGKLTADFAPEFRNSDKILLRIDSGCESGQKFGDLSCDCRDQLMFAMQEIAKAGEGIVINIPHQDGRGMGNHFKLATLSLQKQLQLTTVEAASILTEGGD
jgi:GTP cyclohydrolase II